MLLGPEFLLDSQPSDLHGGMSESKFLADAIVKANRHYEIKILNTKQTDTALLAKALLMVYGSKIALWRMGRNAARQARRPAPPPTAQPANPPSRHGTINGVPVDPGPEQPFTAGTIPGVGQVEFPEGHPLNPGKKH